MKKIKRLLDSIESIYYNIINGITNIKKWYKIIWNDRNFDYSHIFTILEHKLLLTKNYLADNNRHTSTSNDVFYIGIVLRLIDIVKNNKYEEEYFSYFEYSKPIFTPTNTTMFNPITNQEENCYQLNMEIVKEDFDGYIKKYPRAYKYVVAKYPNKDKKYYSMQIQFYLQEKAKSLLFKILNEKIQEWWD